MFCTKCGKALHDDDRFCSYCGKSVREEDLVIEKDRQFNPPFKIEAQRRTEGILNGKKEITHEERPSIAFNWNLDGFPEREPKRTQDIDFNWGGVVDDLKGRSVADLGDEEEVKGENEEKTEISFEPSPWDRLRENKTDEFKFQEGVNILSELDSQVKSPLWEKSKDFTDEFVIKDGEKTKEAVRNFRNTISDFSDLVTHEIKETPDIKPLIMPETSKEAEEIKELEKAIFGEETHKTNEESNLEKTCIYKIEEAEPKSNFYTYNQKIDAFQDLLDKEKDRLIDLVDEIVEPNDERELIKPKEEFIAEADKEPEELKEESKEEVGTTESEKASEAITDEAQLEEEPLMDSDSKNPKNVNKDEDKLQVSLPYKPITVDAYEKKEEELRREERFEKGLPLDAPDDLQENVKKPTLDDIFKEEEEPEKKHVLGKIIVGILILAFILEGIVFTFKMLQPDGKVAKTSDKIIEKAITYVINVVQGKKETPSDISIPDDVVIDPNIPYLTDLVNREKTNATTIGDVVFDENLYYNLDKLYAFEEINKSDYFQDKDWKEGDNGMNITYGQAIIDRVISYFDDWQKTNKNKNLIGINTLNIGEIRESNGGYFNLVKVSYATEDGNGLEKTMSLYLEADKKEMVISAIKEEEN